MGSFLCWCAVFSRFGDLEGAVLALNIPTDSVKSLVGKPDGVHNWCLSM
jgi:hypothetical protein